MGLISQGPKSTFSKNLVFQIDFFGKAKNNPPGKFTQEYAEKKSFAISLNLGWSLSA
jgi:hypothetical protein